MKINIVYWSATGNTEEMAKLIQTGALKNSNEVNIYRVNDISENDALDCDVLVLGCPSYGAENLEESEFQPYWDNLVPQLTNHRLELFGSYDWGNGEWMETWQNEAEQAGATINQKGLIVNLFPLDDYAQQCIDFGENIK